MSDEMFFSNDELSLLRGKRTAARTEVCRPCLVAARGPSPRAVEGVITDMNPHGMLIRMMESIPVGSKVVVQMMRDDKFQRAFSSPRDGTIVRTTAADDGFTDHGIELMVKRIPKASERPIIIERARPRPKSAPARMHTIDVTIGGPRRGRRGR